MKNLWSPWRSEYIESFQDNKSNKSCIFCNAEEEDISSNNSLIVEKTKFTFKVLNLYPYNNGHLMIVPYRHISDITLLTKEENLEIMTEIQRSIKAMKLIYNPDGFNIGANIGKVSGAGIDYHIHFHIVPRWNGDTNFMPVIGEVKVISQDLLQSKIKLIDAFSKIGE